MPGRERRPSSHPRAGAVLVAVGIFSSRISASFASGSSPTTSASSDAADAFNAAFRIPNLLQNLFGEGALSASFIPVYAGLLARGRPRGGRPRGRRRCGLLALTVSVLVLVGVAGGAVADRRHRAGVRGREAGARRSARAHPVSRRRPAGAVGVVPGDPQQPPPVLPVLRRAGGVERRDDRRARRRSAGVRTSTSLADGARVGLGGRQRSAGRRAAAARVAPARPAAAVARRRVARTCARSSATSGRSFMSRGVVQISAYVDQLLASLLPTGAVTGLANAQTALHPAGEPVRHVGVGRRAAGDVAGAGGDGGDRRAAARAPRRRAAADRLLRRARPRWRSRRSATWSRVALPDGAIQPGGRRCTSGGSWRARPSGCSPPRSARLYSSTYYALRDTRTPLRFALVRVVLTAVLGYLCRRAAARGARHRARAGALPD